MISIYISYELIHACSRTSLNSHSPRCPTWTFKNCVRPIFLRASVSIYSRSARVRNVIFVTVGKRVGCGFKHGGFGWGLQDKTHAGIYLSIYLSISSSTHLPIYLSGGPSWGQGAAGWLCDPLGDPVHLPGRNVDLSLRLPHHLPSLLSWWEILCQVQCRNSSFLCSTPALRFSFFHHVVSRSLHLIHEKCTLDACISHQ